MVSRFKEKLNHSLKLKILTTKNYNKKYISWLKDNETNKFLHSKNISFTKSKIENYINNCFNDNSILLFGIFYNDIHIGNFKIEFDIFNFNCAIGYLIGEKNFLGKGIAYKSLKKIVSFLFRDLNIRVIFTEIIKTNKKSIRLIKKNNFKHIYTLKNREFIGNMAYDVLGYEIKNKKIKFRKFSKKLNQSKKKYILKCN